MTTALLVLSAADRWTLKDGSAHPTGFWAEELVEPHRIFTEAGWTVVVATPGGAVPTVDSASLTAASTGGADRVAELTEYLGSLGDVLARPKDLADVVLADVDVVLYPGGHAPMEDLAVDEASGRLLTAALDSGIPLGVLCHAPAALLAARRSDGSWPFAGYRMTGFTDAEERIGGLADKARWLVQSRLVESGADFVEGAPFAPHIEVDRSLHTGQNPASSAALALALRDTVTPAPVAAQDPRA